MDGVKGWKISRGATSRRCRRCTRPTASSEVAPRDFFLQTHERQRREDRGVKKWREDIGGKELAGRRAGKNLWEDRGGREELL